jgi:replicative DNA helicase
VGKCLAAGSEIVLADGSVVPIEEVYWRRRARLLTLQDDHHHFGLTEPSAYVDDGVKLVYRVRTLLGRQVEATAAHPFLTADGWRPVADLLPGERIAVPRRLDVFGAEKLRECEVKLLAYLVGDGRLTGMAAEFVNGNPLLRAEFAEAVTEFGTVPLRTEGQPPAPAERVAAAVAARPGAAVAPALLATATAVADQVAVRRSAEAVLVTWLKALALWGKEPRDRCVPAVVFRLDRSQVALFLNRLFASGGWATVLTTGKPQLSYRTDSERLARQVQHLLLRFGILAALRRLAVESAGGGQAAWQLDVTDRPSLDTFLEEIGTFGKEGALAWLAAALEDDSRHPPEGDVYWD